jgi:modulator of FtsH protease
VQNAYHAAAWQPLWTTVAASSAALLGLLFVALSVNLRAIVDKPEHTARAREALGQLLVLLVLSIFALVPGQDRQVLGAEFLVFGGLIIALSIYLEGQTLKRIEIGRRSRWLLRDMVFNVGILGIPVTGTSLVLGRYGGLFWLVPTVLIFFVWSSTNAWVLTLSAARE